MNTYRDEKIDLNVPESCPDCGKWCETKRRCNAPIIRNGLITNLLFLDNIMTKIQQIPKFIIFWVNWIGLCWRNPTGCLNLRQPQTGSGRMNLGFNGTQLTPVRFSSGRKFLRHAHARCVKSPISGILFLFEFVVLILQSLGSTTICSPACDELFMPLSTDPSGWLVPGRWNEWSLRWSQIWGGPTS